MLITLATCSTYLMIESDGIIRLDKTTAGYKDGLASLCCRYNTSSIGSTVSDSLYTVNHRDFNTTSQDKVGMKRLHCVGQSIVDQHVKDPQWMIYKLTCTAKSSSTVSQAALNACATIYI